MSNHYRNRRRQPPARLAPFPWTWATRHATCRLPRPTLKRWRQPAAQERNEKPSVADGQARWTQSSRPPSHGLFLKMRLALLPGAGLTSEIPAILVALGSPSGAKQTYVVRVAATSQIH